MSGSMLMILGGKKPLPIPENTAVPTVSGTVQTGYVLTSTTGTWTSTVNGYYYQWQRGGSSGYSNISGATSSTYTVQTADQGYLLRCAVQAYNNTGTSSAAYSSATATVPGQVVFSGYSGTQSWTVPPGVTSVSAVAVGRGGQTAAITNSVTPGIGAGGGALAWNNNVSVSPGSTLTIDFQAASGRGYGFYLTGVSGIVYAEGGAQQSYSGQGGAAGYSYGASTYTGGGGVNGSGAGGGAAGYQGNGGQGGGQNSSGSDGVGGGGGGAGGTSPYSSGTGSGGGGVGLLGQGLSGAGGGGGSGYDARGRGGSNGSDGTGSTYYVGGSGGSYGGGAGGGGAHYDYDESPGYPGTSGAGAVRLMWGGGRYYPDNAGNL